MIKKYTSIVLTTFILFSNCKAQEERAKYYKKVGDIEYNELTDNPEFEICDSTYINQYYNFGKGIQYEGDKYSILKVFNRDLKNTNISGQTGYVTTRFLVNCKGRTDRFRVLEMGANYEQVEFKEEITDQLLKITKSLDGWVIGTNKDKAYDYYQYLTFKIKDGNLIDILP